MSSSSEFHFHESTLVLATSGSTRVVVVVGASTVQCTRGIGSSIISTIGMGVT
jgi:hypothetical protein